MRRRSFVPMVGSFESRITPTDLLPASPPPVVLPFDPATVGDTLPILVPSNTNPPYGSNGEGTIAVTELTNPNSAGV